MDFNHLFTLTFGGTFGLVGLIFFCIGLGFFNKRRKRDLLCAAVADAVVTVAAPKAYYAFRVGELTYEKPCPGGGTRAYAVGEKIPVHYDPSNPSDCYLDGEFKPDNVFVFVFGGLGLLFLIIALTTALILL